MFLSLFCRMESGRDLRREKSKTSRYDASEYWYMVFTSAISASTKNKMAPLLAAGLYPSRSLSMSTAVFPASFNFSET